MPSTALQEGSGDCRKAGQDKVTFYDWGLSGLSGGFRGRVRECRTKGDDEQGVGSKEMLDGRFIFIVPYLILPSRRCTWIELASQAAPIKRTQTPATAALYLPASR